MLNINLGHNRELMQKCRRLWEYAAFIEQVNRNLDSGYPLERAVSDAIIMYPIRWTRQEKGIA